MKITDFSSNWTAVIDSDMNNAIYASILLVTLPHMQIFLVSLVNSCAIYGN